MSCVSGPADSNGHAGSSGDGAGVLANLPRTRPQRATARRAAARSRRAADSPNGALAAPAPEQRTAAKSAKKAPAAGTKTKAKAKAAPAAKPKSRPKPAPRRPVKPASASREEVPRQGFECIEERATGAVPPPGGPELVNTAAEIVGELAKAGIAGGERLLRDVLSRLGR